MTQNRKPKTRPDPVTELNQRGVNGPNRRQAMWPDLNIRDNCGRLEKLT